MTDPTTALHEVLALSNKERDAEENREYGAANDLYAELQVAAVNLVRTHGPALLSALERARTAEARAERLADALREEMEVWKASFEQAAAGHATYAERAERLAEAIRAYKSECDNPAKDYVLRAKRRDEMFALLRDHDQEGENG